MQPNENRLVKVKKRKGEIWQRFNTNYLISNYGRWYSISRKSLVKQYKNSSGYYRVRIVDEATKKLTNILTHIQVILFFGDVNGQTLPPAATSFRELGLSIDHISRNKRDNSINNLEIVTHQENCLRKYRPIMEVQL